MSTFYDWFVSEAIGYDFIRQTTNTHVKYPPHNINKTGEGVYELSLAVAGFSKEQLTVTCDNGCISVSGRKAEVNHPEGYVELHHGIAHRDFDRSWKLGEYIEVDSVVLKDGMLTIWMERTMPEPSKARTIDIK